MSFGVDLGDIDSYGGIGSSDGDRAPTKVIYVGVPGATVRVAAGWSWAHPTVSPC
ncbi:hypothetical protein O7621_18910 [Solwaraspora sp. WMMD937]|uniref:hypothetical protein n=1 Tax=Solwaraspora sp. WMMD937 TaxID=3016090 RepID=UPI00249C9B33|nr:hypothetical protein [Solwaraspora sp. WMMD937]WFE19981.1 hypothetical protein O7621_18910 [Solwaraspora sp. WMMD937]